MTQTHRCLLCQLRSLIFLSFLSKTVIENNKEEDAFRKIIISNSCILVYVNAGCLSSEVHSGNGTLREADIALGLGVSEAVPAGSNVEGRRDWEPWSGGSRAGGAGDLQTRAGFPDAEKMSFRL